MKIPEIAARTTGVLAIACICGLLGCSQAVDTSSSSVRANAMEDCQAGRYDAAIAGFEKVLKSDPKDHLSHFQLATLLLDQRKDYLGALVHFRLYLDMRPPDDKTTLAADRIEECKGMLLSDKARKDGGGPVRADASSSADKKADAARLNGEVRKLREENKKLGAENKNLRYLLRQMGEAGRGRVANLNAEVKKMLTELRVSDDEGEQRRFVMPTDKELLDDEGEDGPTVSSPEVKEQIAKVKREEASGAARPVPIQKPELPPDELSGATRPPPIKKPPLIVDNAPEPDPKPVPRAVRGGGALDGLFGAGKKNPDSARPSTYVVQPGDNLMKIAARFYGSRSKWRDIQRANMTTISTDGRVNAGQTIKLP